MRLGDLESQSRTNIRWQILDRDAARDGLQGIPVEERRARAEPVVELAPSLCRIFDSVRVQANAAQLSGQLLIH